MGIEAFLFKAQLRWVGQVMRMPDSCIPKQVFCGQLAVGSCPQYGPVMRYKDTVKENMKKCGMNPSTLGSDSQDRSAWESLCSEAVTQFKDERVAVLQHKRAIRKQEAQPSATSAMGHVITVRGSALPESDCTLTNSLIDDKDNRSVDFDGTVHVCVCVCC